MLLLKGPPSPSSSCLLLHVVLLCAQSERAVGQVWNDLLLVSVCWVSVIGALPCQDPLIITSVTIRLDLAPGPASSHSLLCFAETAFFHFPPSVPESPILRDSSRSLMLVYPQIISVLWLRSLLGPRMPIHLFATTVGHKDWKDITHIS